MLTRSIARDERGHTGVSVRPQSLIMTFCGIHMLDRNAPLPTRTILEVLDRMGIGEHTARSTLNRMADKGLFKRHRDGRRVCLKMTDRARAIIASGRERTWETPVNREWDCVWTVLSYSLPESRRQDRDLLRSRLQYAGFGSPRSGLWVAPGTVDLKALDLSDDLLVHIDLFRGSAYPPTQDADLASRAWDLEAIEGGYEAFIQRWDRDSPPHDLVDPIVRHLSLEVEWVVARRHDPGLPVALLPRHWPASRAEHLALHWKGLLEGPGKASFEELANG